MNIQASMARSREPPEKKNPVPLSPKWVWMVLAALSNVFKKSFWVRVLTPEHQATWHVASAVQTAQILGSVAAYKWLEVHAPWVLQALLAVIAGVKAILTAVWLFLVAVFTVAFE